MDYCIIVHIKKKFTLAIQKDYTVILAIYDCISR